MDALEVREFDWTRGLAADAAPETVHRIAAELGIPPREADYRMRVLRERAAHMVTDAA